MGRGRAGRRPRRRGRAHSDSRRWPARPRNAAVVERINRSWAADDPASVEGLGRDAGLRALRAGPPRPERVRGRPPWEAGTATTTEDTLRGPRAPRLATAASSRPGARRGDRRGRSARQRCTRSARRPSDCATRPRAWSRSYGDDARRLARRAKRVQSPSARSRTASIAREALARRATERPWEVEERAGHRRPRTRGSSGARPGRGPLRRGLEPAGQEEEPPVADLTGPTVVRRGLADRYDGTPTRRPAAPLARSPATVEAPPALPPVRQRRARPPARRTTRRRDVPVREPEPGRRRGRRGGLRGGSGGCRHRADRRGRGSPASPTSPCTRRELAPTVEARATSGPARSRCSRPPATRCTSTRGRSG